MRVLFFWYALALAMSAALVPACRAFARKRGYVATPRADRWHATATALFGGVAMAVTVLALAALSGHGPRLLPVIVGGGLFLPTICCR